MDRVNQIYTSMIPMAWYRSNDFFDIGVSTDCARRYLNSLERGGLIESIRQDRRKIYITKQRALKLIGT